jgi:hypothetical protein
MIDFTYFGVREIRDVVKTRGHLLRAGFLPDSPAVNLLTWIRDRYVLRVGLGDYVSQMLDKAATVSVRYCMLVSEDGQVLAGSGVEGPDQAAGVLRIVQAELEGRCFFSKSPSLLIPSSICSGVAFEKFNRIELCPPTWLPLG